MRRLPVIAVTVLLALLLAVVVVTAVMTGGSSGSSASSEPAPAPAPSAAPGQPGAPASGARPRRPPRHRRLPGRPACRAWPSSVTATRPDRPRGPGRRELHGAPGGSREVDGGEQLRLRVRLRRGPGARHPAAEDRHRGPAGRRRDRGPRGRPGQPGRRRRRLHEALPGPQGAAPAGEGRRDRSDVQSRGGAAHHARRPGRDPRRG